MRFLWSIFEKETSPSWVHVAFHSLKDNSFSKCVYKYNYRTLSRKTDNPILLRLINLWYDVHKTIGKEIRLSPKSPLNQNELIPMTVNNKILETWHYSGIHILEDCFEDGLFMSFEQLRRKYNLPSNTFFCYLQLRSFLRSTLNNNMTLPKLRELRNWCKKVVHVSLFLKCILCWFLIALNLICIGLRENGNQT